MRLEPLYRATFTTPEAWSVELADPAGTEGQSFLIAERRCEGRLSGRLRGANYPRRRTDNALLPDFRGVLQTAGGAAVRFAWHGHARPAAGGIRELVGSVTHVRRRAVPLAERRRVHAHRRGTTAQRRERVHVEYDVAELVWEPLA